MTIKTKVRHVDDIIQMAYFIILFLLDIIHIQIVIYGLLGHCLATLTTGSYLRKLYKRPGHCIPHGDTVTE